MSECHRACEAQIKTCELKARAGAAQGAAGAQAGSVAPEEQEGEQDANAIPDAQRLTRAALEAAATARQEQSGGAAGAVQSAGGGETLTEFEA